MHHQRTAFDFFSVCVSVRGKCSCVHVCVSEGCVVLCVADFLKSSSVIFKFKRRFRKPKMSHSQSDDNEVLPYAQLCR